MSRKSAMSLQRIVQEKRVPGEDSTIAVGSLGGSILTLKSRYIVLSRWGFFFPTTLMLLGF